MNFRCVPPLVLTALLAFRPHPAPAQPVLPGDSLLEPARQAYHLRAQRTQAQTAVEHYEKAAQTHPSYEGLCEGARAIFFLGTFHLDQAPRALRLELFDKGIGWARQAVTLKPREARGRFWLATLLGLRGKASGFVQALLSRDEIRREANLAFRLDPNVECAGPYRLLGRFLFKLPGVLGGDRQRALELLGEGVKRCPGNDMGRYFFAEALQASDQKEKATQQLDIIFHSPPDPEFLPERPHVRRLARQLRSQLN